jgi:hypothetical protein
LLRELESKERQLWVVGKEKDLGSMARAALNKRNRKKKGRSQALINNTPPETNK